MFQENQVFFKAFQTQIKNPVVKMPWFNLRHVRYIFFFISTQTLLKGSERGSNFKITTKAKKNNTGSSLTGTGDSLCELLVHGSIYVTLGESSQFIQLTLSFF